MVIQEISRLDVIGLARETLGLPVMDIPEVDDAFIACSTRRLAGFLCPCNSSVIKAELMNSLSIVVEADGALEERIDQVIDKLVIGGDLLELNDIPNSNLGRVGMLYAAPPSFTIRPNGQILIIGITADEVSPPGSIFSRIEYEGFKRLINPLAEENLASKLIEIGLVHLNEKTWLRLPNQQTAEKVLNDFDARLKNSIPSGDVPGLVILDFNRDINFYRKRWVNPKDYTGTFVARRPQVYGAPIWCYAELKNGIVNKFIDMPLHENGISQRACDAAWFLQMAIDHCQNRPQEYRVRIENGMKVLDFFSPLPIWAERRFIAVGSWVKAQQCLFSYSINEEEFSETTRFLKEYLWLMPK